MAVLCRGIEELLLEVENKNLVSVLRGVLKVSDILFP
ncbi:hypothetical protein M973_03020 [Francisella orientalis LADL 07-285A]|nr:hypothetical protein M973_03020 [Francisella orientalis LADL 07-285A]